MWISQWGNRTYPRSLGDADRDHLVTPTRAKPRSLGDTSLIVSTYSPTGSCGPVPVDKRQNDRAGGQGPRPVLAHSPQASGSVRGAGCHSVCQARYRAPGGTRVRAIGRTAAAGMPQARPVIPVGSHVAWGFACSQPRSELTSRKTAARTGAWGSVGRAGSQASKLLDKTQDACPCINPRRSHRLAWGLTAPAHPLGRATASRADNQAQRTAGCTPGNSDRGHHTRDREPSLFLDCLKRLVVCVRPAGIFVFHARTNRRSPRSTTIQVRAGSRDRRRFVPRNSTPRNPPQSIRDASPG